MNLMVQPITTAVASIALAAAIACGCASATQGETTMPTANPFDPSEQAQPATDLLRTYETALNGGDVDTIVSLYAPDAVFMAQHRAPSVGQAQIEAAYREIFGMIRLAVSFEIDEVVVVSPTVAYARTRSTGKTTILANSAEASESNQELFVLVRSDSQGEWKIGRYIFSTTKPLGVD